MTTAPTTTHSAAVETLAAANRPVLLPDVTSFDEVLAYLGEWDHASTADRPAGVTVGRNELGPFCTVDLSQIGGARHRSIAVRLTSAAVEAVAGRLVTDGDRLSVKVIAHQATGYALVVVEHGHIIGSHWLAYIDPATIPAA